MSTPRTHFDWGSPLIKMSERILRRVDGSDLTHAAELGPAEVGSHSGCEGFMVFLTGANKSFKLLAAPRQWARLARRESLVQLLDDRRVVESVCDVVLVSLPGGGETNFCLCDRVLLRSCHGESQKTK